jgi:transcriptional regulator with PAS, ATPase and Fis domain
MNRQSTAPAAFDPPIVGSSPSIEKLKAAIPRLARSPAGVLITGESGVGKELFARNLHFCSPRRERPFIAVNCAALNSGILESELFGHGRGSFTGAFRSHAGLFEQAEGGTIFLDEIGEVPLFMQSKLLRVLQDHEIRRMGASETRKVDVRVISATNVDLEKKIEDGGFRLDLFYRLNVIELRVPPIRERDDDIFELIAHLFDRKRMPVPHFPEQTRTVLRRYHWPGNVRELENEVERLTTLYDPLASVTPGMLSERIVRGHRNDSLDVRLLYEKPLPQAVGYLEKQLLKKTLSKTDWNKSQTARTLGLSRQGLLKKIKRYGITREVQAPGGDKGRPTN